MTVNNVWIIADDSKTADELCSGGSQLGKHLCAVLFGSEDQAKRAIALGAERVYLFDRPENSGMIEGHSQSIVKLLQEGKADLALFSSSACGQLMAGRIASQLGTCVFSNISEISAGDDGIVVKRLVYGGAAVRMEKAASETAVVTVEPDLFDCVPMDETRSGEMTHIYSKADNAGIRVLEIHSKQSEPVNLSAAKRVVGVGRGFEKKEDLKMAEELAALIGAETACSRPVAEGMKWMSKDRYVGVSGAVLKPDIYLSIGISGQIQHMVGVNQAKTLMAINKDRNAPIFKQVDIGLIGDLYKVLPKIVEKIRTQK